MADNTKLATILATKNPAHVKKILELRERYACLMEKQRDEILSLQGKAIYLDYIAGEGRIMVSKPQYYERNGSTVETYFRFIDKVH